MSICEWNNETDHFKIPKFDRVAKKIQKLKHDRNGGEIFLVLLNVKATVGVSCIDPKFPFTLGHRANEKCLKLKPVRLQCEFSAILSIQISFPPTEFRP